jgi:hypothetical protein
MSDSKDAAHLRTPGPGSGAPAARVANETLKLLERRSAGAATDVPGLVAAWKLELLCRGPGLPGPVLAHALFPAACRAILAEYLLGLQRGVFAPRVCAPSHSGPLMAGAVPAAAQQALEPLDFALLLALGAGLGCERPVCDTLSALVLWLSDCSEGASFMPGQSL